MNDEADPVSKKEWLQRLQALTNQKSQWSVCFPLFMQALDVPTTAVKAKALWLIGEACYAYPELSSDELIVRILPLLNAADGLLRERAVLALGRLGRGTPSLIEPQIIRLVARLEDPQPSVRMNAIWACENIAASAPEWIQPYMQQCAVCLSDAEDRVRIEAPEIFRVMGARLPLATMPYRERLLSLSEMDENRVVRIHALGAVRVMDKAWKEGASCRR